MNRRRYDEHRRRDEMPYAVFYVAEGRVIAVYGDSDRDALSRARARYQMDYTDRTILNSDLFAVRER